VREHRQEFVLGAVGPGRLLKQARVVGGERGAAGQLFCGAQVVAIEPTAGFGGGECDEPERAIARGQRHEHQRAEPEPPIPIDWPQIGSATLDDGRDAIRRVGIQGVAARSFPAERLARRIEVRDPDAPGAPAGIHDVHEAPVGQLGNRQPSQRLERRLVFERGAQDRAGLGEEREPALGSLSLHGTGDDVRDGGEIVHVIAVESRDGAACGR